MMGLRIAVALAGLVALAGCLPPTDATGSAQYEQHKANREAYLYQGL